MTDTMATATDADFDAVSDCSKFDSYSAAFLSSMQSSWDNALIEPRILDLLRKLTLKVRNKKCVDC